MGLRDSPDILSMLHRWFRGKPKERSRAAPATVQSVEGGVVTVVFDEGRTRTFEESCCMFTPFVGLEVLVEPDPTGGERLRLTEEAGPRYTRLLAQQAAEQKARAEEVAQAERAQRVVRAQQRAEALARQRAEAVARVEGLRGRRDDRRNLEARVEADGDPEALLVLADLLEQEGQALGRLINLQMAEVEPTAVLRQEVERLQQQVAAEAGLPDKVLRLEWRRGLIEGARLACNWSGEWVEPDGDWVLDALVGLAGCPAARFLRRLTLGLSDEEGGIPMDDLALLGEAAPFTALRELTVGDFDYPDEMEMSWTTLGPPPPYAAFPNLERLVLQAGAFQLGQITLPRLRQFEIRTGGLTRENLQAVLQADWPRLERLVLWFGDANYGADVAPGDLAPLLESPREHLRHLGLCNAEFTDELCSMLHRSPLLPRLRVLDLSRGTLSDEGARAIMQHADRFAHLEQLHVEHSFLSPEGVALLGQLSCTLHVGEQEEADNQAERYVSVGE